MGWARTEVPEPVWLGEKVYGSSSAISLCFADIAIACHVGDSGLTKVFIHLNEGSYIGWRL